MIEDKPKLIEYILFPIFILAFFLTLFSFDIIQRIGGLFGKRWIDKTECWFNRTLLICLKILGTKVYLKKAKINPENGPFLIISNHQSMFDISTIYVCLSQIAPRFVSKIELSKWIPGVSICLRLSKAALIDRSNPSQAIAEISRFGKYIKDIKGSAVIFPEGTRARDGIIKNFKHKGTISLAKECMPCWIIPLAIEGSWHLQKRKNGPIPTNVKIQAECLEPIFIDDSSDLKKIIEDIEVKIKNKVIELRS